MKYIIDFFEIFYLLFNFVLIMNKTKASIVKWLAAIGPGLFLIGYNIGTGSVTTMAQTGAIHSMRFLWVLALSCIFTYILMIAYGKTTLVSGKSALTLFRDRWKYGWLISLYILIALIIGELLALMGIMGIVSDLIAEALIMIAGVAPPKWLIILLISIIFYYFIMKGKYSGFEKLLTFFVITMGLSFSIVFLLVSPPSEEIIQGFIPQLGMEGASPGLIAAIAGTTCSAAVFIMRSTVLLEKGWNISQLKTEKRDALVSSIMMFLLSGLIMAVSAGTLYLMHQRVDSTLDLIHLFKPLGGTMGAIILIFGVASAGLSTVFPIVLIAPWLWSDYKGIKRDLHSPISRMMILIAFVFAFGSVVLNQRPPALMIFSQAFQACILPAVVIPIILIINDNKTMKHHKIGPVMNVALLAVLIFSLFTTWFAIKDLIN